jgi:hypothetical protein
VKKGCGLPAPTPLDGEEAVRLLNVLNSDVLRWDVQAATFRSHVFHHPENFGRHLDAIEIAGVDGSLREPHLWDSLIVMMHRWTPVAATGSGDVYGMLVVSMAPQFTKYPWTCELHLSRDSSSPAYSSWLCI